MKVFAANMLIMILNIVLIAHEKNKCVIVVTHSREISDETDIEYVMSDGMIKNIRV